MCKIERFRGELQLCDDIPNTLRDIEGKEQGSRSPPAAGCGVIVIPYADVLHEVRPFVPPLLHKARLHHSFVIFCNILPSTTSIHHDVSI